MSYNSLGQLERITTNNNGAYKRFWYGPHFTASYATVNNVADEAYSVAVVDGLGRVTGTASNHPGSSGGYDAAGNRISMTDALGWVTYTYSLSRITSETRTFPVGNFTINYAYNRADQLTSVTDPFGASFSFSRDLQGRLTSVSGNPLRWNDQLH